MNTFLSLRNPATQLDPAVAIVCLIAFIAIVYIGVKLGLAKGASNAVNNR